METLKRIRFPLEQSFSYLVEFIKDNKGFGIYVYAIDESEAISQAKYYQGKDIEITRVKRERPDSL